MNENEQLQLFEDQAIRTAWDEENEEWYFSVVDVVSALTDAKDYDTARNYWKVTKKRLKDEGSQLVTDCNQLKLKSPKDGKRYKTLLAIGANIPSLYNTYEYSKETMRGQAELTNANEKISAKSGLDTEYITHWSYGIGETWSLLIPNVKGGATGAIAKNTEAMQKADP